MKTTPEKIAKISENKPVVTDIKSEVATVGAPTGTKVEDSSIVKPAPVVVEISGSKAANQNPQVSTQSNIRVVRIEPKIGGGSESKIISDIKDAANVAGKISSDDVLRRAKIISPGVDSTLSCLLGIARKGASFMGRGVFSVEQRNKAVSNIDISDDSRQAYCDAWARVIARRTENGEVMDIVTIGAGTAEIISGFASCVMELKEMRDEILAATKQPMTPTIVKR